MKIDFQILTTGNIFKRLLILGIIVEELHCAKWSSLVQETRYRALKCFKCVNFDCHDVPEHPFLCNSANEFLQESLRLYYQMESPELPACPRPIGNELEWETMKTIPPSSITCPGICTLGRLQITTAVGDRLEDRNVNVIHYGTVMGCVRHHLMMKILPSALRAPISRESTNDHKTCHLEHVNSSIDYFERTEHVMALEHCAQSGDVCNFEDFCLDPRRSYVKPFVKVVPRAESAVAMYRFTFGIMCTMIVILLIIFGITMARLRYLHVLN